MDGIKLPFPYIIVLFYHEGQISSILFKNFHKNITFGI